MNTLSLKKKQPSVYAQCFRWRLTSDMHDTLDKTLDTEDIMDVQLVVTFKNGEQKVVQF